MSIVQHYSVWVGRNASEQKCPVVEGVPRQQSHRRQA